MESSGDILDSRTTTPDATLRCFKKVHSVLDAQLNALALGESTTTTHEVSLDKQTESSMTLERVGLEGIIENFSVEMVDQNFAVFKSKGPNSLLGTGSSIASASDHSEVSDFESDSGIETSHVEAVSPKVGGTTSLKKRKGVKLSSGQPMADLPGSTSVDAAIENGASGRDGESDQSDYVEEQVSCDIRIDSLIRCMDHKVSVVSVVMVMSGSWEGP